MQTHSKRNPVYGCARHLGDVFFQIKNTPDLSHQLAAMAPLKPSNHQPIMAILSNAVTTRMPCPTSPTSPGHHDPPFTEHCWFVR